ncbi:MAG: nucleoside deaminase [Pseudomonadota bacterium]
MNYPDVHWPLPTWVSDFAATWKQGFSTQEDRADFVLAMALENVRQGTGGPFSAAVFAIDSHRLVAPGVNLVTSANASSAHAEIVALCIAQQLAGNFDLGSCGDFELIASTAPCAMCLGAVPWSGVSRLVCCARGSDAEAIGFDEGAKPIEWIESLRERGIEVVQDVCRDKAVAVLEEYAQGGGVIYNPERSN